MSMSLTLQCDQMIVQFWSQVTHSSLEIKGLHSQRCQITWDYTEDNENAGMKGCSGVQTLGSDVCFVQKHNITMQHEVVLILD